MSYVLGIDGGGTKTICVLMDREGCVVGRGIGGASNYQNSGLEIAFDSIRSAIGRAVESRHRPEIAALCLGLAGADRPADFRAFSLLVERLRSEGNLPVRWSLHSENVTICNDSTIALVGGTGKKTGTVAIAGTGSIVFGRNRQGVTKRAGGWGHILGDGGSAYSIAVKGMGAALKSADGILGETILAQRLLEHLGLENLEDSIGVVYGGGWGVKEIAAIAPIIDLAAAEGDEVARGIMAEAVGELVETTQAVMEVLFQRDEAFEIVTVGSVWQGRSGIREKFAESVAAIFPRAKVIWPRHEPAWGAGILALDGLSRKYWNEHN